MKIIVWQCIDWCCEDKPFSERWWNARVAGQSSYVGERTPFGAWQLANDQLSSDA